jgi:hypothetical protein
MGNPVSNIEHIYIQAQALGAYAAIPNTSHVATVAATDALKTRKGSSPEFNYTEPRVNSPDKQDDEGLATLDSTVAGKRSASYTLPLALRGGGAAGTPPDCHPALLAMFGKYTNTPNTSDLYELQVGTYPLSFVLWRWIQEITGEDVVMQEMIFGCLVNQAKFAFGQDFATLDLSGPALWGLSNDQYSTADVTALGDLTTNPWTTPGEPASQTYVGSLVRGFMGSATINGKPYTNLLKSGGIDCNFNRTYDPGIFGQGYHLLPSEDKYEINPFFTIIEDDTTAVGQAALRAAWLARTPVDITFTIGTVAGAIWTWALKNVKSSDLKPTRDDSGRRYQQTFRGKAHSTNATTRDELKLTVS